MVKQILKKKFNPYFPGIRKAAVLIVLPACFVVVIYFFSILQEIATHKKQDPVAVYEKRFSALGEDLPVGTVVNYITNHRERTDFVMARYASIPIRMIQGQTPMHDYLVAHLTDPNRIPEIEGYAVQKNYGNGVILFKRIGQR